MFRIDGYLKDSFADDKIVTWLAKQFSAEMAIGDTVFLWRAKGISCIPGIIAKGKVVSLPENQKKSVEDYWIRRKDFKEGLRARNELGGVGLSRGRDADQKASTESDGFRGTYDTSLLSVDKLSRN